jgi:hypothetical protein
MARAGVNRGNHVTLTGRSSPSARLMSRRVPDRPAPRLRAYATARCPHAASSRCAARAGPLRHRTHDTSTRPGPRSCRARTAPGNHHHAGRRRVTCTIRTRVRPNGRHGSVFGVADGAAVIGPGVGGHRDADRGLLHAWRRKVTAPPPSTVTPGSPGSSGVLRPRRPAPRRPAPRRSTCKSSPTAQRPRRRSCAR